jgi:hypothetical protein
MMEIPRASENGYEQSLMTKPYNVYDMMMKINHNSINSKEALVVCTTVSYS